VSDLILQRKFTPNMNYDPSGYEIDKDSSPAQYYDLQILKFGVLFFLTAILRDRSRFEIIKILPVLKKALINVITTNFS
jgi:hypothetical protein